MVAAVVDLDMSGRSAVWNCRKWGDSFRTCTQVWRHANKRTSSQTTLRCLIMCAGKAKLAQMLEICAPEVRATLSPLCQTWLPSHVCLGAWSLPVSQVLLYLNREIWILPGLLHVYFWNVLARLLAWGNQQRRAAAAKNKFNYRNNTKKYLQATDGLFITF